MKTKRNIINYYNLWAQNTYTKHVTHNYARTKTKVWPKCAAWLVRVVPPSPQIEPTTHTHTRRRTRAHTHTRRAYFVEMGPEHVPPPREKFWPLCKDRRNIGMHVKHASAEYEMLFASAILFLANFGVNETLYIQFFIIYYIIPRRAGDGYNCSVFHIWAPNISRYFV